MTKREINRLKRLELIKRRAEIKKQEIESQVVGASDKMAIDEAANLANNARSVRFKPNVGYTVSIDTPEESNARIARVVGRCINVRLRMLEFEDGSHGKLWVRRDDWPMLNWVVWVHPDPDHERDFVLHGTYNPRGIRTS